MRKNDNAFCGRQTAIRMNTISFLFKRDPKKFLGRWNVDYCQDVLHSKIRMANEDHCGTCGNTVITEQLKKHRLKHIKEFKDEYINVTIRSRTEPKIDTMERQIEYYICMN